MSHYYIKQKNNKYLTKKKLKMKESEIIKTKECVRINKNREYY